MMTISFYRWTTHFSRLTVLTLLLFATTGLTAQESPLITRIATNLNNPRGVAVLPDGRLVVVEAGDGLTYDSRRDNLGRVNILEDANGDGDYDDDGEITPIFTGLPGYNGLPLLNTGHDEVDGVGDVIVVDDRETEEVRIFFTKGSLGVDVSVDPTLSNIGIMEITLSGEFQRNTTYRPATLNALAYDPVTELIYFVESGLNQLSAIDLNGRDFIVITEFANLEQGQQAVPTGVAIDPTTGDVLVALFSGQVSRGGGTAEEALSFMPGAAKIVRVDPITGEQADEITDLTTAIDVTLDEMGNIYVLEMTTSPPTGKMPRDFPLADPNAPLHDGGYRRFDGRVTMFPVASDIPVILAEGLDVPTNITYHEGNVYVSTGQGTPGRPIPSPEGDASPTRIVGEIYRISDF